MATALKTLIRWTRARGIRDMRALTRPTLLLWALALEVDEREATRTGEQVCRRCGGSGTTWAWGHSDLAGNVDPDGAGPPTVYELNLLTELGRVQHVFMADIDRTLQRSERERWAWREPCPCNGPTRPDTIALRDLVTDLAGMSSPRFQWPDEWHVRRDERADSGGWISEWWRIFAEWTLRGKEPDADELAPMLAALIPELEAREKAKRAPMTWDLDGDIEIGPGGTISATVSHFVDTPSVYSIEQVREAVASMHRASFMDNLAVPFEPEFHMEPFREDRPTSFMDQLAHRFAQPLMASMRESIATIAKLDEERPPEDADPGPVID